MDNQFCDFCKFGRLNQRSLRIAFRQETNLGGISCLADIPVGVCDRCGSKNFSRDVDAIAEDAVRREYVKLLSSRRRKPPLYPNDLFTPLSCN
jgi:hypothetical protein